MNGRVHAASRRGIVRAEKAGDPREDGALRGSIAAERSPYRVLFGSRGCLPIDRRSTRQIPAGGIRDEHTMSFSGLFLREYPAVNLGGISRVLNANASEGPRRSL